MKGRLHELVPLVVEDRMVAHLFCDARGFPGRLAAVAYIGNDVLYTDFAVPDCLLRIFRRRKDNQIMGLELLSIALGLSTFSEQLRGKNVVVWSDNTGSEHGVKRGACKAFGHSCVVHCVWLAAAKLGIGMHVNRVPTELNIADLPSRELYEPLVNIGAAWVKPVLDARFWKPESWEALSLLAEFEPDGR